MSSDMYTSLAANMISHGWAGLAEVWILSDKKDDFQFKNVRIRLFTGYEGQQMEPVDVVFVRGDHPCYMPFLPRCPARRFFFYAASGKGIPRLWKRYHGILVDDINHKSIVQKYYPGVYVGEFMKTAEPEIFRPLPDEKKEYDISLVGDMFTARKNLGAIKDTIAALPDLKIAICSKKPDPDIIAKLGGQPRQIEFLGFLPRPELNKVYNRSRLGVITANKSDASPRIILEFMAAGLPILANEELCGIKKFLLPGSGELSSTNDFKRVIPDMLKHIEQYKPHDIFLEHFHPEKMAADFARHVHAIMEMPDEPPKPSWRGMLARVMRSRVDKHRIKGNHG
ncbi:MAG: glycosyltransferase [Sedimentisphaerales bacterium]|nr:glycosyltransferase [Sedimentisphaerales bacterium]